MATDMFVSKNANTILVPLTLDTSDWPTANHINLQISKWSFTKT